MRKALVTRPALLAGLLLLTACGPQKTEGQGGGPTQSQAPGSQGLPHDSSCGAQPSATVTTPGASALPGGSSDGEKDGVAITSLSRGTPPCAEFEVTNRKTKPFSYTITFTFLSGSGEALESRKKTVPSVKPGRTAKGAVTASGRASGAPSTVRVRIAEVRRVPADEAPSEGGSCPPSGIRVYADDGDAAMGLRVVSLHLENCGTQPYRLNGHPRLQPLDKEHKPIDSVTLQGGSSIATGTGADGVPQPLDLKPGERAYATLVWRNTVEGGAGDPVNAPYARVWAKPGAAPVMVIPELDLGTTGKLGVGPWKKDEKTTPGTGGASGARPSEPPAASPVPAQP
ncbi:DUF4232 domain-containing protein [Streptomyces triculaminicus]|uniref:DUF4232 domain-containing protein n=2 Tax=Streptomyces TaxID=1883 RepID=A0A939FTP5_9ACTN|nr:MULTISPECIES: DUF4232 domain-containing protein [Streptomyces]MBO0657159.1 DUF4232 domain-containing protein [Streptomyces triculaminicus]QSY49450.1 DUF4232 domain-containing protein [Streptomyces griseocarneus]